MFEQGLNTMAAGPNIKVIGIGGAGNNAVNGMVEAGVQGVEFYIANTDAQMLSNSKVANKVILGQEVTRGLGAGSNPDVGRAAALESEEEIRKMVNGADMVFITAGMGGGTGTGAAPIIAKIAKEQGALVIGIITKPFTFEGKKRNAHAYIGLKELKSVVDSLVIISNDRLLEVTGSKPLKDAFKDADNVLRSSVQTITDLISVPALINLDFADIKSVLEDQGQALIGIGKSEGEGRAEDAALKAVQAPLIETTISGARQAIVNVTGGSEFTVLDANDAVDTIKKVAGGDINIILGVSINENLTNEMIVTVIATGFDPSVSAQPEQIFHAPKPVEKLSPVQEENIELKSFNTEELKEFEKEIIKEEVIELDDSGTSREYDETEEMDDLPSFLRRGDFND